MKIESTNDHLMVMAAVRYCLGRKSYIVSSCIEFLNSHWDTQLQIADKRIIIRDIAEYLQDYYRPDDTFDYTYWKTFGQSKYLLLPESEKKFIKDQMEYRNKPFPFEDYT